MFPCGWRHPYWKSLIYIDQHSFRRPWRKIRYRRAKLLCPDAARSPSFPWRLRSQNGSCAKMKATRTRIHHLCLSFTIVFPLAKTPDHIKDSSRPSASIELRGGAREGIRSPRRRRGAAPERSLQQDKVLTVWILFGNHVCVCLFLS